MNTISEAQARKFWAEFSNGKFWGQQELAEINERIVNGASFGSYSSPENLLRAWYQDQAIEQQFLAEEK